jgi:hypothetical protein
MRDILFISEGDMNNQRIQDRLLKTSKYLYEVREESKRKGKELIRERTRDDSIYLRNKIRKACGAGKQMPAFRPIPYKPKGIVYG